MSEPTRTTGPDQLGGRDHPSLRLRPHSRLLLPDLYLPSASELRAVVQRLRTRRRSAAAEPPSTPPRTVPVPAQRTAPSPLTTPADRVSHAPERAASADVTVNEAAAPGYHAPPLYWRLLRLHHVRPNGWLRALYFEGAVAVAVVLVLAEAASVWTILVLPAVVAVLVKANDVVAGSLRPPPSADRSSRG